MSKLPHTKSKTAIDKSPRCYKREADGLRQDGRRAPNSRLQLGVNVRYNRLQLRRQTLNVHQCLKNMIRVQVTSSHPSTPTNIWPENGWSLRYLIVTRKLPRITCPQIPFTQDKDHALCAVGKRVASSDRWVLTSYHFWLDMGRDMHLIGCTMLDLDSGWSSFARRCA